MTLAHHCHPERICRCSHADLRKLVDALQAENERLRFEAVAQETEIRLRALQEAREIRCTCGMTCLLHTPIGPVRRAPQGGE